MPRICSQRGCNIQLSRTRIENGLTCARHGRQLRCGNPVARRVRNRRVCKRPSCGLRLSGPRLSAGCSYCALHGGPWPTRPLGLGPRLRANSVEQLECSADFLAPRAREGCVGSRVLLQLLRQCQGYPGGAHALSSDATHPRQRASRAALAECGFSSTFVTGRCRNFGLADHVEPGRSAADIGAFHGSLLSENHHISIRNQASLNVATRPPRDRFTFVSWGSTGATKGLNAFLNRPRSAVLEPGCCQAWGRCILRFFLKVCPRNVLGRRVRLELYSVAWVCCEVSKTDSSVWAPRGR